MPHLHIQRTGLVLVSLLSAAAASFAASAQAAATNEGIAYRLDDGKPAYREIHMLYESGGAPARLVLYRCMDGTPFARKIVVERTGAVAPDFDFIDGRTGYREGARSTGKGSEVYWQKSRADGEKRKIIETPADAVIDAGFDAMIRAHWTQVGTREGTDANFLLPSAMRFLKVRIQRVAGTSAADITHLRMKLDTWYGFAAPDTDLVYSTGNRRLLRFKGIGSIRDGNGRTQAVRIEFPGGLLGRPASASEIEAVRRLPLTGRCGA
jgi:hypothetical protein